MDLKLLAKFANILIPFKICSLKVGQNDFVFVESCIITIEINSITQFSKITYVCVDNIEIFNNVVDDDQTMLLHNVIMKVYVL